MQKSWLEQHPRWKIPLGALILILLIVVFGGIVMTVVTTSFRRSDVYKQAMARASESLQVREQFGEPLEIAWLISGNLNVTGSTGRANLSIPVSGPRGRGVIRAVANKTGGVWRFSCLQVCVSGQSTCTDLLSSPIASGARILGPIQSQVASREAETAFPLINPQVK
jgi:hypothetical protein